MSNAVPSLIDKRHWLGHDVIDSQHAALADCWHRTVTCERMQFPLHIARLKRLMARHFDQESKLMQEGGGTLCRFHRNEHRMLLNLCCRASSLYEQDWKQSRNILRKRFPALVRDHIICMDLCAVLFLHSNADAPHAQESSRCSIT